LSEEGDAASSEAGRRLGLAVSVYSHQTLYIDRHMHERDTTYPVLTARIHVQASGLWYSNHMTNRRWYVAAATAR
jgi:hypothetical protein